MMGSVKINYVAVLATVAVLSVIVIWLKFGGMGGGFGSGNRPLDPPEGYVNLKALLGASIDLAERGGDETYRVKQEHQKLNAESKGLTKEGAKEMKTNGDMNSHRAIIAGFAAGFPELKDRIVSEEHDTQEMQTADPPSLYNFETARLDDEMVKIEDVTIWIDPLDATQEYTEDLNQYVTVMVCVAVKGKPTIGVIRRPFDSDESKKETLWAWVGHGHSSNLKPQLTARTGALEKTKVIISRSHTGAGHEDMTKAFDGNVEITPAGGAGYKTVEVIRGKQDVYAHVTLIKKWDICSGHAMLDTLGGKMKMLTDEDIDYDKSADPQVTHGLIGAMANFDVFLSKIAPVYGKSQK